MIYVTIGTEVTMESTIAPLANRKSLSATAIIGIVFGVIAFSPISVLPVPFIGLLLSIIGLFETGLKYGKRGRYIAITGIILNAIAILWFISYITDNFGYPT